MKRAGYKLGLIAFGVLLAGSASASVWSAGIGDWGVGANWGGTVPDGTTAYVNNGGTATVGSGTYTPTAVGAGYLADTTGTILVNSGGTLTLSSTIHLGRVAGATGTLTVDGGVVTTISHLYTGQAGTGSGTVNVKNSGQVSVNRFYGGEYTGSSSIATVSSGGSLASSSLFYVAKGGIGTLDITGTGSSVTAGSTFYAGIEGGSSTVTISFGGLLDSDGTSYLGFADGDVGSVSVTGAGSLWDAHSVYVGRSTGTGSLTIDDGGKVYATALTISANGSVNMKDNAMLAIDGDAAANLTSFLTLVADTDNINYWDGSAYQDITTGTEGVDYTLSSDGLTTTLTVIPESATMSLFLLSASILWILRRVRR